MIRHTLPGGVTLFHADCRDTLRSLPDNSIDAVCTDPPYELNFMGKGWDDTGIANDPALWREVYRVLKPGGHLAAFSASRTYHRMACAIEDAGFEIRDSLMWLYGTGFPKSQNVAIQIDKQAGALGHRSKRFNHAGDGAATIERQELRSDHPDHVPYSPITDAAKEWSHAGTALKPAFEPIVLARKPLSEPTVAANVLRWRTGALNIDGCRVATDESTMRTTGTKATDRTAFGKYAHDAGGERMTFGSDAGRWPANVVTDGSDEVVGMFPTGKSGGYPAEGLQRTHGVTYGKPNRTPQQRFTTSEGSAARFFYSAKASKADRNGSKHPTVKPIALMQWLARLITPPGGTILDPFAGSGTTGAAAVREGFTAILCEREAEYIGDICGRFPLPPCPVPLPALPPCPVPLPA